MFRVNMLKKVKFYILFLQDIGADVCEFIERMLYNIENAYGKIVCFFMGWFGLFYCCLCCISNHFSELLRNVCILNFT